MANVKIPELSALTSPSPSDLVPVADVSTANDEVKKTTVGEIVGIINGDVDVANDGTATISELPVSKLQDGDARQLLQTDAAGTGVEWTDNVDVPGTLGVTGQSTLASAAVSDLTEDRVVIAGASGELEDSANLTFDGSELGITGTLDVSSNGTIGGDLTVVGDLTVEGATTTLETQTVTVEDKNIELGVVDTPSDTTANGGGITLRGTTNKTINWVDATDAWTFSEHIELASGKEFYIDGNSVLNASTLGSGVTTSSLTTVGTIGTGVWQGTTVATGYGGTGQVTYANGELLIGTTAGSLAKATITAGSGIDVTNGDGTITVDVDLKTNGGLVLESTELAVDLGASAITGTLGVADGGTGQTTYTDGELLIGTSAGSLARATLTAGSGIDVTNDDGSITVDVDLKADGGLVIESTELALDLGASSITGTLGVADGGTGIDGSYTDGELLIGKTDGTLAKATLTAGTGVDVTNANGSVTVAIDSTVVTTSDTGTVTSTMILDGTIVNGDINDSAAIADTKLATIATAGKVSNSATTATDANTASAIVARDASGNFTAGTITAALTGNADTATALETARDIGGVSFDGTANINLPGVNAAGDQDTSGNAATATKLNSSRTFAVTGDVTGTVNSDLTSGVSIATSIASEAIVDADINPSAAIAGTKIDPNFGSQTVQTTGDLAINTDVLFVDSSESAIGIGTTGPAVACDVVGQVRASTGILFGSDTAAANALDDYEEGTWDPTFKGTSTPGTPTYSANGRVGKYTKVGNKVTAWAYLDVTALGGAAGNINITGLPFDVNNLGFGNSGISVGHADGTLGNGVRAYHGTDLLELRNNNAVVAAATGQIYIFVVYTV